jgi:hypothetical protein
MSMDDVQELEFEAPLEEEVESIEVSPDKRSVYTESALLGIPIPIIYISEEPDNKEYVIDGQQRLTSFFSFLDGSLPNKSEFKLTGLKVFRELNGKRYGELSDPLQDAIRYFKLRTVTFKRESDPNLKFEIFERLIPSL